MIDEALVLELIKEMELAKDVTKLRPDLPLKDQGVDSLEMMTFYLKAEEKFGIKISDEEVEKINSIRDLVEFVNAKGH